jgi:hypothetical protein
MEPTTGPEKDAGHAPACQLRQFEVLLRIHFHIVAGSIRVCHRNSGLDHLLQQMDQIGLLNTVASRNGLPA